MFEPKIKGRHVIFLGAGASFTSGYPIGEDLRLRLASEKHFSADLNETLKGGRTGTNHTQAHEIESICQAHFKHFAPVIELFRHGGFGTVDEFSKLAANNYPQHTQEMKKLMRLAFALHNPEGLRTGITPRYSFKEFVEKEMT